ncbi:MAG: hypothetical protein ACRDJM_10800 [Actinomycetota bacterium]
MSDPIDDVAAELERIEALDPAERAAATEALEARLRAVLDGSAGA